MYLTNIQIVNRLNLIIIYGTDYGSTKTISNCSNLVLVNVLVIVSNHTAQNGRRSRALIHGLKIIRGDENYPVENIFSS